MQAEIRARVESDAHSPDLDMGPLVTLDAQKIEDIVRFVPGGQDNIQDIYPLLPLQEGLLFHRLLNVRDPYVLSILFELTSQACIDRLIAALQEVIRRHDVLRSAVLWQGLPQPLQVVCREARLPVQSFQLQSDAEIMEHVRALMKPGSEEIDLQRAPLMRLKVYSSAPQTKCYALLHVHHIVSDHESLRVIAREAIAIINGQERELGTVVSYRTLVEQTRAHYRPQEAEQFFRAKLHDLQEPAAPFGLSDVHGDGSQIEEAHRTMDPRLAERVRERAQHLGVSAARLFHAAWAVVVARTSGRDDVVFGTVLRASHQRSASTQTTVGLSVNTLPIRLDLAQVTARELVTHVHRELLELLEHNHTPLQLVQRCSGLEGSAPLFTTLLNCRRGASGAQLDNIDTATIRVIARGEAWTNYPVAMTADDVATGFELMAQSDRRLDPSRVLGYFCTALESLVDALCDAPETLAARLSVVPELERRTVLEQFNAHRADYPQHRLIHELFEEQAALRPQATAVMYEGARLSYAELNSRANQLARFIGVDDAAPQLLVGICMERSVEMLVAVLATLKAGGAYVPLDPEYPAGRLAHILEDAAPKVLLTQSTLRQRLPAGGRIITFDDDWHKIAAEDPSNLRAPPGAGDPRSLAYVIFTSGSTGRPKGVMIEHASVVNLWWGLERLYSHVAECERVALNASINFDASIQQIVQLLSGRSVFVVPAAVRRDPGLLLNFLQTHRIESFDCTPSQLRALIAAGLHSSDRHRPKLALIGGEAIDASLWAELAACDTTQYFNVYGPTECTVDATAAALQVEATAPHIGRPMLNRRVYILDEHRQPVPIGVIGELYIGGDGVARGYLNRPELTAYRFGPDPFVNDAGARLYRTGDLGRWGCDGTIEYFGRSDHQVKLRGYRIELGEIEARLRSFPAVHEALVVVREDMPGDQRLVAYVTLREPTDNALTASAEVLRQHLVGVLPEYMVPTAFVVLSRMPQGPSGKLDRRALPVPDATAYARRTYEAPRGEIEEVLAGIWQGLLRTQRIGRQDNFFELGGHSLLIVRMMEQLRRVGLSIEIRSVFESPTLAHLAARVSSDVVCDTQVALTLVPIGCTELEPQMFPLVALDARQLARVIDAVPGGASNIQDIYPLAPLQEGILFHSLLEEQGADVYVVSKLLSVSSRQRLDQLIEALQKVIARHDVLRTSIVWEQLPQALQVVWRNASLPVRTLELDARRDRDEQIAGWIGAAPRIDLRCAPLLRLEIAQDFDGRWLALLQLHHMVGDITSQELLASEVAALLEARERELPDPQPYRIHIAQIAAWSKRQNAEAFFKEKLDGFVEPSAPFGLLDVHGSDCAVHEYSLRLDRSLAQRVRASTRTLGLSAATLFHAAWALVVAHTSGRDDVVFGSVLLGRLHSQVGAQQIMGMFINTLPIRLQLRALTTLRLLQQTQRELVDLMSHEQASLSIAQRCSGIAGSAPLFTSLLNYRHGAATADATWSGARGIEVLSNRDRTNYPIVLSVDQLDEDFVLVAQSDRRIDAVRIAGYAVMSVESLVSALEQDPSRPALRLPILPAQERRQILELFNSTQRDYAPRRLVHELFEAQVERSADAVAVCCDGRELTYDQLNQEANRLAHHLIASGVGPDQRVGVFMERSVELVVALLATLKAGGAYVPLDTRYPIERLRYMLKDSAPAVVLTQEPLREHLPEECNVVIVGSSTTMPTTNPDPTRLNSRHLAYVIYTSGSTGAPKGVAVEHCNAWNLIQWTCEVSGLKEGTRCSAVAAIGFDAATWEILPPLTVGASAELAPARTMGDTEAFIEWWMSRPLDVGFLPTPMAELIFSRNLQHPTLRLLHVGGDRLNHRPAERRVRLINNYGPTESTVVATSGEVTASETIPHIGRPIANTSIYILDRDLQPVPAGVQGELYVGGEGVARGYLGRPELQSQRFIADPFSSEGGARMYRSGDLARWREDGNIEFLGRNDEQVKIRGYRIELGEIEAQLLQHPQVSAAAVLAREDIPGQKRLVAYVTSDVEAALSADELRAHLKLSLPDYMIPAAFVRMSRLPLTTNGKLDRRALPQPDSDAYGGQDYEAPQGEIEQAVAKIWMDLLQLPRLGRSDNFFDLGAHSLLAMQAATRIRAALSVSMPMRLLFKFPTVQELSLQLEELRQAQLIERLATQSAELEELLSNVAAMSESHVEELVRKLSRERGL